MAHVAARVDNAKFRGRNDNSSQTSATWIDAVNTDFSVELDTNFRIRIEVLELDGGSSSNVDIDLEYSVNGGAWTPVTATSNNVRSSASAFFADGESTTQQLGSATFITPNNGMDDVDGTVGVEANIDFAGNDAVEVEYCVQLRSADLTGTETIELRAFANGITNVYTNTASVTITLPPPVYTQDASRQYEDDAVQGSETFFGFGSLSDTPVDTPYRFVSSLYESASIGKTGVTAQWQYKHSAGTNIWTDVTASSSVIKAVTSAYVTQGDDCLNYVGGGGRTFITDNNAVTTTGTTGVFDFAADGHLNSHLVFEIVGADVADGDIIQLRVVVDGVAPSTVGSQGVSAQQATGYSLSASSGSLSLSGQTADLLADLVLDGAVGSFSLSGAVAGLSKTVTLVADAGGFTSTGVDAALSAARNLVGGSGSFVLTGTDADLEYARQFAAEAGSFTITGIDVGFAGGFSLPAAVGAFSTTGQGAELLAQREVAGQTGTFTLAGQTADLQRAKVLPASAGAFSLSGQDTDFLAGYNLLAEIGAFTLTGVDADLQTLSVYDLPAESGTFALVGSDIDFKRSLVMPAEAGNHDLTGQPIAFGESGLMLVEPGSFIVSGIDADLKLSAKLRSETGTFTIAGTDLALKITRALAAGIGAFSYTGSAAKLTRSIRLPADAGIYSITGQDVGDGGNIVDEPVNVYVVGAFTRIHTISKRDRLIMIPEYSRIQKITVGDRLARPAGHNRLTRILPDDM